MGSKMGRRFRKEAIYVYLWLIMLRFERKQQNSVKQLPFNINKIINFFLKAETSRTKTIITL